MSQNKNAYFQGGGGSNEPTPGKKKYKSDPALVVQPRFEEPFYCNYDLYAVPGMENVGPGTGWHGLQNYKSVKDFLNDRRKRLQPRYAPDDSWQLDNGKRVKKNPDIKARLILLDRIIKQATDECHDSDIEYSDGRDAYFCSKCLHMSENCSGIPKPTSKQLHGGKNHNLQHIDYRNKDNNDFQSVSQWRSQQDSNNIDFPSDEFMDPAVEEGINNQADHNTNEIGGFLDDYLPENDFEDKDPSVLNFGRDYTEDAGLGINDEDLQTMIDKYLNPSPPHGLYGLPDGVDLPDEDLEDPTNLNPEFGTTENGITMYEDKWNI